MSKQKKELTAPAIAKMHKPGMYPVGSVKGLYLDIRPSGNKAWSFMAWRPTGKQGHMALGGVITTGKEPVDANGKPIKPAIGGDLTLAGVNVVAADLRHRLRLGIDVFAERQAEKERRRVVGIEKAANTFPASAIQYFAEHKVKGRKPRGWQDVAAVLGLAYADDGGELIFVKSGLAERWKDKPVSEVTGHDIYALIDEARRYGIPGKDKRTEGLSEARGRHMASALGGLFEWLTAHRKIVANPCTGVYRPPAPAARTRVLNTKPDVRRADELRWFWQGTGKLPQPWPESLRLLLILGCRRDEIAELRWKEVSDDFATIRLDGTRTKNGRAFSIPLPPLAQENLRSVKRIEGSPFVFTGATGETPMSGWSKTKDRLDALMLELARDEHGEDAVIEDWRVHDLRRTCATGMASIGIQPHIIEACLNHISGAKGGVAGVYNVEDYVAEKKLAFQRWAEHIERVVSGASGKIVTGRFRA